MIDSSDYYSAARPPLAKLIIRSKELQISHCTKAGLVALFGVLNDQKYRTLSSGYDAQLTSSKSSRFVVAPPEGGISPLGVW